MKGKTTLRTESFKAAKSAVTVLVALRITFVAGETYLFSVWGKNSVGTKAGVNGGGGPSGSFGGDVTTTVGSTWTQKVGTVKVPAGSTWMQVYMQTDEGGDCNVDGFVLRRQ